jgi:hypothetical protein
MPGGASAPGGGLAQAAQVAGTAAAEEATEEAEEVASETPAEETPPETANETPPEETPEASTTPSDAELQSVLGPVPPDADSNAHNDSVDYMKPIPGSEQSDLSAFLAAPGQVVLTRNYGESAPDDAPLLVGGSGVDYGPHIGFFDALKVAAGGATGFLPEGLFAESTRLRSVDNPEYDGIADYAEGDGEGWRLDVPTIDDLRNGAAQAYQALMATFGEGQNAPNVSNLEYDDIDSYPEEVGSGLVDLANSLYAQELSVSNEYRAAIENGEFYRAGQILSGSPLIQGAGLAAGTFSLTRPFGPNSAVLNSSRTGQATGIERFDRLFADSNQAQIMIAGLERRGVTVIDDVSRLDATASAHLLQENGQLVLIYDSKSTSFIDMLHESRHVAQVQRAEAAGVLGQKNIFGSPRLLGAAERGAYEYELRLGNKFSFSDNYMNYLNGRIDYYYPNSYSKKFTNSPTMNSIFNAMEPNLKP